LHISMLHSRPAVRCDERPQQVDRR
jgi:hypothetical protein